MKRRNQIPEEGNYLPENFEPVEALPIQPVPPVHPYPEIPPKKPRPTPKPKAKKKYCCDIAKVHGSCPWCAL